MKKAQLFALAAASAITLAGVSCSGGSDSSKACDYDKEVEALLSQMTLDEKIGQLNQRTGVGLTDEMAGAIRAGSVGSLLNEVDPETVNALQREAVENSRLGIPLIFSRDVVHGFKTIYPIPLGQAATWNPALVEEGARVAADEASSVGIRWTFSPMLDVARDSRWGRIAEGFGEDPYLTSVLGEAMIRGYQTDDLSRPNTMAACAKHFAAYGFSENGKDYNSVWMPESRLRDVVLPPFKKAAESGAATFMCSFNEINDVPTNASSYLLRDILRDEWGWNGMMVSDWGSIMQMVPQGHCTDLRHAAAVASKAGVDMDMESYAYIQHLKDLVEKGEISEKTIDGLVRNVLRLKYRLGLFDNPYVDLDSARRFYTEANLDGARRAAEESAVLLTNNGILPLKENVRRIAVTGPLMDAKHDQNGTWCFDMEKEHTVTALEALTEMYGKDRIIAAPGLTYSRSTDAAGIRRAAAEAAKADVILFFAGEEAVLSGEAHCRADISLPGAQTEMLRALKATGKPVVTIIMAGRALTIPEESKLSDAVLYIFHPGTMGGPAIANLLSGKVNPSGRLPLTMPRMTGQLPLYYAHNNTGRPASGIVLIDSLELEADQTSTGCTSFYLDARDGPLIPFGPGLSYTAFKYGPVELSATEIAPDGSITASCEITNTGEREGSEVAQLYVRDLVGSMVRPVRELKAFEKITLAPGESRKVSFTLDGADLAYTNAENKKITEPGEFRLWISPDSQAGEAVSFTVK
ncbi:MAG: beta-glucosidase BglX [Muribaculaceae bacterium]